MTTMEPRDPPDTPRPKAPSAQRVVCDRCDGGEIVLPMNASGVIRAIDCPACGGSGTVVAPDRPCGWCGTPHPDGPRMCPTCDSATKRRAREAAARHLRQHLRDTVPVVTLDSVTEAMLKWLERKGVVPW